MSSASRVNPAARRGAGAQKVDVLGLGTEPEQPVLAKRLHLVLCVGVGEQSGDRVCQIEIVQFEPWVFVKSRSCSIVVCLPVAFVEPQNPFQRVSAAWQVKRRRRRVGLRGLDPAHIDRGPRRHDRHLLFQSSLERRAEVGHGPRRRRRQGRGRQGRGRQGPRLRRSAGELVSLIGDIPVVFGPATEHQQPHVPVQLFRAQRRPHLFPYHLHPARRLDRSKVERRGCFDDGPPRRPRASLSGQVGFDQPLLVDHVNLWVPRRPNGRLPFVDVDAQGVGELVQVDAAKEHRVRGRVGDALLQQLLRMRLEVASVERARVLVREAERHDVIDVLRIDHATDRRD